MWLSDYVCWPEHDSGDVRLHPVWVSAHQVREALHAAPRVVQPALVDHRAQQPREGARLRVARDLRHRAQPRALGAAARRVRGRGLQLGPDARPVVDEHARQLDAVVQVRHTERQQASTL